MSLFNSLKDVVVGQAMKLAANPRVTKLVSDPRLMNAAMKAMSLGGAVKTNMDRAGRLAAGAFGLATQDEVATLRSTIQTLEDQVATLQASGPPAPAAGRRRADRGPFLPVNFCDRRTVWLVEESARVRLSSAAPCPSCDVPLERLRFGQTSRKDAWWVRPLIWSMFFILGFGYLGIAIFWPHALLVAALPDAAGLAAVLRRRAARHLRAGQAVVVAAVPAAHPGRVHRPLPRRLPPDLLLLPRRLLQGAVGGPARLRRR